jgi:single-strand DNA-binding protein
MMKGRRGRGGGFCSGDSCERIIYRRGNLGAWGMCVGVGGGGVWGNGQGGEGAGGRADGRQGHGARRGGRGGGGGGRSAAGGRGGARRLGL